MIKKKISNILTFVIAITIVFVLIVLPELAIPGVSKGILICGNVIVPAIFPFMVCVLIIMKTPINIKNSFLKKTCYCFFGHSFDMFLTFLLSLLGGYTVGAKLINQLYIDGKINIKTANIMCLYCVNAGPAFVISAVGVGMLNSKKIGILLFLAHIFSSVLIAFPCSKALKKESNIYNPKFTFFQNSLSEIFISSTAEAASSVMNICFYVIIFSAFSSYWEYFFGKVPMLKNVTKLVEITIGISQTKNIFLVSFLLGFAGISIWCQILSLSKEVKIKFSYLFFGRILHGSISVIILFLIIKFTNCAITVFSNIAVEPQLIYNDFSVSVSLCIMLIVLLICIYTKKYSGKFICDMI